MVVADLFGARGDRHLARRAVLAALERDAHDAAAVAREDRRDLRLLQKVLHLDHRAAAPLLGDQAAVVRERPLDQLRHQFDVLQLEQHLGLVRVERHLHRLVLVLQQPVQLRERARRYDHFLLLTGLFLELQVPHRQPEAVGGGQRQHVTFQHQVDAREHRSRIVRRRREHDLGDRLAQRLRVDLQRAAVLDRRDRREVVRVDAADRRLVARAFHLELLRARRQRQLDLVLRQRVHEVREQP